MIPPNITNTDLLEIIGDVYVLIGSGMFNNRVFDFPYSAGRYEYDADDILSVMPSLENADFIRESIAKVYTCDLGLDKVALLNENSKIIAIIDPADGLAPEQRSKTAKYIVLR